jgi:endonuclease III
MPSLFECYPELVDALASRQGPPPRSPALGDGWEAVFRAAVGRVAGESIAARGLAALTAAGMVDPASLAGSSPSELRDLLNEAGVTATPKVAALIHRLAGWFDRAFADDVAMRRGDLASSAMRADLCAINGVGPGTADAVLLALGHPRCPIDPGIYRILVRHGWCDVAADYDEASEALGRHAAGDAAVLDWLARGLSDVGRKLCGVRAPKCDRCALAPLLPDSGPVDPHA